MNEQLGVLDLIESAHLAHRPRLRVPDKAHMHVAPGGLPYS